MSSLLLASNSEASCELDQYLPKELDFDEVLLYQSSERLMDAFNFDALLSGHRAEFELFDPIRDDEEVLLAIVNDQTSAMGNDDFGMSDYFLESSTVIPHVPNVLVNSTFDNNCPLSNSSASSPVVFNDAQIRQFFFLDKITGRERRPLLHEFIRLLLDNDEYSHIIQYVDRRQGIFKLYQPKVAAELWKHVKGRTSDNKMTYEKFSRALRHYYGNGIMHSNPGRFTFRFGLKSGFGTTWWPAY